MSALLDQLAKQSRLLTVEERATLARILIDELDLSADGEIGEMWVAEDSAGIKSTSRVRFKRTRAMKL